MVTLFVFLTDKTLYPNQLCSLSHLDHDLALSLLCLLQSALPQLHSLFALTFLRNQKMKFS